MKSREIKIAGNEEKWKNRGRVSQVVTFILHTER